MIVVGGEQAQGGQPGLCMLCSYDDSGKKIADWVGVNAVCLKDDDVISCAGLLVLVWDRKSCTIKAQMEGHAGIVRCLAFHPLPRYSQLLFSGSMDRTIRVFDLTTYKAVDERSPWTGHSAGINALVFAPIGDLMASRSCDKSVRIWNSKYPSSDRPQSQQYSHGHRYTVSALCWSGDARLLVSGGRDKKICYWNAAHDGTLTDTSAKQRESDNVGFIINALQYIPPLPPAWKLAARLSRTRIEALLVSRGPLQREGMDLAIQLVINWLVDNHLDETWRTRCHRSLDAELSNAVRRKGTLTWNVRQRLLGKTAADELTLHVIQTQTGFLVHLVKATLASQPTLLLAHTQLVRPQGRPLAARLPTSAALT